MLDLRRHEQTTYASVVRESWSLFPQTCFTCYSHCIFNIPSYIQFCIYFEFIMEVQYTYDEIYTLILHNPLSNLREAPATYRFVSICTFRFFVVHISYFGQGPTQIFWLLLFYDPYLLAYSHVTMVHSYISINLLVIRRDAIPEWHWCHVFGKHCQAHALLLNHEYCQVQNYPSDNGFEGWKNDPFMYFINTPLCYFQEMIENPKT